MNILYVEDDSRDADLVRRTLAKTAPHYKVEVVPTVHRALVRLEEAQAYDLVLSDLKLPDGDGLSLLSRIRERALPLAVVLITGAGDEEIAVAALKAGAQDYVVKREDYLARLPSILEDALERYRAEAAMFTSPLHVLYAERNINDLDLTRRHLTDYAPYIHLEVVNTATEALQKLPNRGPYCDYDVILLDYRLPDLNALETLKELRQGRGIKTPVVLVTGQGDEEIAVQAIKLGAADYIIKNKGYLFQLPSILEDAFHRAQLIRERKILLESEERYRTLFEGVPVGLYRTTADGKIIDANTALVKILSYPDRESLKATKAVDTYVHSEDRDKWQTIMDRDGIVLNFQKQSRCYDGSIIWVEEDARVVRDEGGQILYYEGSLEDITERKRLEEQLFQSQKMEAVGRLAGGIAHDFNNLLTIISGNAQLSLLELKEGDPLKENLEEIRRASDRASALTRQLLAFSRRQMMEMKVLNLNIILRDLEKMLHRVIGEDIELVTSMAGDLENVKADPGQIEQVIVNMVVNARDAMQKGGKLTIETANVELDETYARDHMDVTSGCYVMISVSDTGIGMTKEVKEQIFEPFFTTKEKGRGTGLGLSTVYGIVKQSGGHIWVGSEPDKGTIFKIYFPRVDEPPVEIRKREVQKIQRGSETILIVEDDEMVRKLAVRILKMQGYTILESSEMEEALFLCEKEKKSIHLLLTDVVMPRGSGRELVDRLKSPQSEMKVLYMSGYTDDAIIRHGVLEEGINFIHKPFSVDELAKKVREVLDK